ncbi:hypothetical protein Golob_006696 [Gossypium lobatum]|uniref:Uncharacterized protein n=2 Tax=Gossypium TaxID=3633 RepID=A0A7J8MX65_9ROSI|nr:hypothetical protein [Gossypium lobatum]
MNLVLCFALSLNIYMFVQWSASLRGRP